ncbi:MAG: D-2-hydroxyacid dehydrogenase [Pseudomonadota bacterium]
MTVMVIAEDAHGLADHLGPLLPGEHLVAASSADAVERALQNHAPEAVFAIRTDVVGNDAYRQVLAAPSVRYWHVGGSGYEWLGRWDGDRLAVTNGVGVLAPFLADTVIGAVVMLNNGLLRYRDDQAARVWQPGAFPPLAGQRLAIVGAGAIGQAVAMRARAMGIRVTGLTRDGRALEGFDAVAPLSQLSEVLGQADIVSCHLRLTAETRGIFDAAAFAAMQPGALFLNSARGGCVDEVALLAALSSGHLRGAWLDVFEVEPLPVTSPLWSAPNLLITPHASDMIQGWDRRFADLFALNLGRWRRGEPLINPVAPPK